MSLNRKNNILACVAAIAVVAVLAVTAWSAIDVRRQTEQITLAEATAKGVTQFRFLIMETALYGERRTAQQWQDRLASFRTMLASSRYDDPHQDALLEKEQANVEVLARLYDRLVQAHAVAITVPNADPAALELTAGTVSALFLTTQDMTDDAFELLRLNRLDLEASQNRAAKLMLLSIAVLACLIAAGFVIMKRRVLRPIAALQDGVARVADGDLGCRVALAIDNEIGALASSFDDMTSRLERSHLALQETVQVLAVKSRALAHAQDELQTIIDHMPALVGYWDRDLINRFGNKAYLQWFDIDPIAMRGKHLHEVIGPEKYRLNLPYIEGALRGEPALFERMIVDRDGNERASLASYLPDFRDGEVIGFYVMVTDITSLKKAQQAQAEAQEQLRGIFDAASEFCIIATGLDGIIKLFSVGAERMLGFRADEMVGRVGIASLHLAQELEARSAALSQSAGRPVQGFEALVERARLGTPDSREWTFVCKDGSTLPVNLTVTSIRDDRGEAIGYLGIAKDIRTEKQILRTLADALDAAQGASLAKSRFLANVSHEIRTPMNAVMGMLQLMQHTSLSALQADYVSKTQSAAQSLLGLLNDVLDFSKVEAGKMILEHEAWALDTLMRDLSVILSANTGEKDIDVLFSIDPHLPANLRGDALRLQQVLLNLAGNAIKFTEDGEVTVALRRLRHDARRTEVEFTVSDTGIGIPADKLQTIFEGFNQAESSTTRRYGGTGLGLAISQRLVALMGGELVAQSECDVGSTFRFALWFENARPDGADAPASSSLSLAAPARPMHILLVDDNPNARRILAAMVESQGWQCSVAADADDALEQVRQRPAGSPFSTALVDWNMPAVDGWETARRLRQQLASQLPGTGLPVVLMVNAHGRGLLAERERTEGGVVDGFLIKPVTASMLAEAIMTASRLPVSGSTAADRSAPPQPLAPQPEGKRLAGLRLLVVDDNPLNQQVAGELLASQGALVEFADCGIAAVEKTIAAQPLFDAVLMDIQMPDLDGYDATRRIRQYPRLRALPILAMTANARAGDKEACLAAGMNDHVEKPIRLSTLVHAILTHCDPQNAGPAPVVSHPLTDSTRPLVIELAPALSRLGGDRALLVKLAKRFAADASPMLNDVQQHLMAGRPAQAASVLHAFKTMAATVGATSLRSFTAGLETRLQTEPNAVDASKALHRLLFLVDEAHRELQVALNMLVTDNAMQPKHLEAGRSLIGCIDVVESWLRQSDMRAVTAFAELEEAAVGLQDDGKHLLAPLAESMRCLDFKGALEAIHKLRESLPRTVAQPLPEIQE